MGIFGEIIYQSNLLIILSAVIAFLISGLVAYSIRQLIKIFLSRRRSREGAAGLGTVFIASIQGPLFLLILGVGLLIGLYIMVESEAPWFDPLSDLSAAISRSWLVIAVIFITFFLAKFVNEFIDWYLENVGIKTDTVIDDAVLATSKRVLPIIVYTVGILIAVDSAGVSISPILAGLGVGGLAVALAVQPTLSNFFAGTYVVTEGELKVDDYIELEGGPAGFVVEVGWRSTKIRSRFNNLIIIPNSKMAESIVTNYYSPEPAMITVVRCGVSYSSDLKSVREISLEEAAHVIQEQPEAAISDWEPIFRYRVFGESNIDFVVVLQAADRASTFLLESELIERLHERFKEEGIEINYPVRKVVWPESEEFLADRISK